MQNKPIPTIKKRSPPGAGLATSLDVHSADALIPLLRDGVAKALTLRNRYGPTTLGGRWFMACCWLQCEWLFQYNLSVLLIKYMQGTRYVRLAMMIFSAVFSAP